MNISKNNIDEVNAQLTVKIEEADYADRVTKVLKDYRKKANLPGFRPGMVPMGLLRKQHGKSITLDEINKLMGESISKYLDESEFKVLGEPLPSEDQELVDLDNGKDFEFKFDIAMAPAIEMKLTKRDKIKSYGITITDEMVEKQVNGYAERFGQQVDVDAVDEKDVVKGMFVELNDDGSINEDGILVEETILAADKIQLDDVKAEFIGANVDKVIRFNPMKAFGNATDVASMLKIDKEAVENLNSDFNFTIKSISRFEKAELNKELYTKAYGEDVETEEDFISRIKEEITSGFEQDAGFRFGIDAKEKLVKKLGDITLPEAFLKRWLLIKNAENESFTAEKLEEDFPKVLEGLKWDLIKSHLAKQNEIKTTDDDIKAFAKKTAKMQFAQYGMANVPEEHLDNYAEEILKNPEQGQQIVERAFEDKVVAYIKDAVKVEEVEISLEDFNKLFEN